MAWIHSDRLYSTFLGVVIFLNGCSRSPEIPVVVPASPNAVVAGFWRIDTGHPISSPITVARGKEFYAIIELEPVPNSDGMVEGRSLMPPQCWPCVAISYPAGESINSKRAVRFSVLPLRPFDPSCNSPSFAPAGPQIASPQYRGNPQLATTTPPESTYQSGNVLPEANPLVVDDIFSDNVIPLWTFLGKTHESPGEYTLEFFVHPFASLSVQPMIVDAVSIYKTTLIIEE